MRVLLTLLLVSILGVLLMLPVNAEIPKTINYQGVLTTSQNIPVTGVLEITFALYMTETDSSPLWQETQQVSVENGSYTVILGSVVPLNLTFDEQYYLGVTIKNDVEMSPRLQLTSVAYSLNPGPQGEQGPVGPQGPQGEQGPIGPQGPVGPTTTSTAICLCDVPYSTRFSCSGTTISNTGVIKAYCKATSDTGACFCNQNDTYYPYNICAVCAE